jgi:hypothetical protein
MASMFPAAANAAPVYLKCELTTDADGPLLMRVQLNEQAGTAAYSFPDNGDSFSVRAIFAPEKVSFGAFVVDRTTLGIQRINNGRFDQSVLGLPPRNYGQCELDNQTRAF